MGTLWQDVRFGFRMLLKNPGFTAVAVLSMALGIGANSTIYSLVDAALFSPLPVKDPGQLVTVYSSRPTERYGQLSYPDFAYFREHNEAFSAISAYNIAAASIRNNDQTEFLFGEIVSGDYFSMLGVQATLGRTFLPEEDQTPNSHPVVIVSHGLWQRSFGSDPGLIGKTIKLNGYQFTVIGIMPKSFTSMLRGFVPGFWVPMMMYSVLEVSSDDMLTSRADRPLWLIGRLKPGMSTKQAEASLNVLAHQLAQAYPDTNKEAAASLIPAGDFLIDPQFRTYVKAFMAILMAVVGLVLLIACANVANLLLARNSTRKREIAIRLALGASRWRLVRQLLTESILLGVLGGAIGLVLALWASNLFMALKPPVILPVALEVGLNVRVLEFTLLLAILTGVIFGLAPALHSARLELVPLLKDESGKGGFRKSRLRNLLVVSQVAMSLILLIGAALTVRSLQNARSIHPGIETKNRLAAMLDVATLKYSETQARAVFRQLEERLQTLPDVQSVSWTSNLPLGLSQRSRGVIIDGHEPSPDGEPIHIACDVVSPEYFTTMGIPVLQGRAFTRHDDENAPKVVIINEAMAQLYWPGENPIGKRFRLAGKEPTPVEVVGVVRTGKYRTLGERPRPYLHMPLAQQYCAAPTLVIHTAGNPKSFIPTLRRVMREVDDNVPFIEVKTMQEHMHLMVMPQRVAATVLGTMGVLALILAAVGLYGVMSYSVSHRTQEIGIRMALGARCNDVLRLVVRQGMALTGVGMAVGLIASLGLSHFLSYLLYGVGAADPLTFAGITLFLALVALLACYVPARRAAKVDPMEALRYE